MMHSSKNSLIAAALLLFAGSTAPAQNAPMPAGATTALGPVSMTYHKSASFAGNQVRLRGNVQIDSSAFGAQAETIVVDLMPGPKGKGSYGVGRATMDALPAQQVSGHFEDTAQGRNYKFHADHAVYVPDNARAGGGRIDLTGHVRVEVNAADALDGPLVTITDHATVLLGQGTAYPQVETGAGHLSFTPLNGGQ